MKKNTRTKVKVVITLLSWRQLWGDRVYVVAVSFATHQCCGTVTIYCGSGSNFGKVSIPVLFPDPNTEPDPDHVGQNLAF